MTIKTQGATALLAAATLLSACVSQSTYNQEVKKASTYQQLDTQLKGEVAADQAQITQLQNVVRVTLANGILFPEGGWELNAAGKDTLAKLAPVLKTLTGQKIEVKGYTDNVPIGPELRARFPSNVELSKARAQSVADFLVAQGVPADHQHQWLRRCATGGIERHRAGPREEPPRGHGHRRNEVSLLVSRLKERKMKTYSLKLAAAVAAVAFAGIAAADYPLMNLVADRVIQKYQSSSCEQLWAQKQQPKSEQEQRLIGLLKNDPQLRTAFLNKVAGPISNKMFECGMIP